MYHVCVIQPEGYVHSRAFDELVDLVSFSIRQLGHGCSVATNNLRGDAVNIVVGCHLLPVEDKAEFPPSSIFLNTEPLFSGENMAWSDRVAAYARNFAVWDYNQKNIDALKARNLHGARLLRIGYQAELARIPRHAAPDIDVLFYGSYNDRRRAVLDALRERNLNVVTLFGVYGAERDAMIARAKVILNMHYYDQHIFEIVRVFYLMTNGKAVVAEVGQGTAVEQRFLAGVHAAPYEGLVDACTHLVRDAEARARLEAAALESIITFPQALFTEPLLAPA